MLWHCLAKNTLGLPPVTICVTHPPIKMLLRQPPAWPSPWQTVHAGNARTCWINSCNLEIINEKKNKDSVNLARSTIRVFVDHFLHVHVKSGMVDCFVHLFTSSCQSHCDWVTAQSRTFQISTLPTSQWSLEIASQTKAGFLGFESLLCECDGPLWHKVNV